MSRSPSRSQPAAASWRPPFRERYLVFACPPAIPKSSEAWNEVRNRTGNGAAVTHQGIARIGTLYSHQRRIAAQLSVVGHIDALSRFDLRTMAAQIEMPLLAAPWLANSIAFRDPRAQSER